MAKFSFDLYGAISPNEESAKAEGEQDNKDGEESKTNTPKERRVSQVEVESALPQVSEPIFMCFDK